MLAVETEWVGTAVTL